MAEFELTGGDQDETRLLRERTSGYSVPLPGHPVLTSAPAGLPRYDVIVQLRDVEAEHGFRLDTMPTQVDAQALALMLATAYANGRAKTPPRFKPVSSAFRPQGVTGGAHAIYPLAEPAEANNTTMEQLWLLLRPSSNGLWALYHTTRFRTAALNHVQWAHLRSAILDQSHWDPQHPRDTAPRLWPDSSFALPSAKLDLTEPEWQEAEAKAADVGPLSDEQTLALANLLRDFALIDQTPRYQLSAAHLQEYMRLVATCGPTRAAAAMLRNLERCKTMHDLRAWTWQCIWAIGNRHDRTPEQRTIH